MGFGSAPTTSRTTTRAPFSSQDWLPSSPHTITFVFSTLGLMHTHTHKEHQTRTEHWRWGSPTLTGIPFNDAYRYMDWLLTVPLLLIEILLVMKLDEATFSS